MKEWISYFGEIIVVVAVSGVLYTAAPDGKTKKYVHFVISLCVLAATVFPLISLAEDLPKNLLSVEGGVSEIEQETADDLANAVVEASRAEIEEAIRALLCKKFDYKDSDIDVALTLDAKDTQNVKIIAISVKVSKVTTQTKARMKEYLEEMFLGETAVTVESRE